MPPSLEIIEIPDDDPRDYQTRPHRAYMKEPSNTARSPSLNTNQTFSPIHGDPRRSSQTPLYTHTNGGSPPYPQWPDRPSSASRTYSANPGLNGHHSPSPSAHHLNGQQDQSTRSPSTIYAARVSSTNGAPKTAAKRTVGLGQGLNNHSYPGHGPAQQSASPHAPPTRTTDHSQRSRNVSDALSSRDGYHRVVSNGIAPKVNKRPRETGEGDALLQEISVKKARTTVQNGETRPSSGRLDQDKLAGTASPRQKPASGYGSAATNSPGVNGQSRPGSTQNSALLNPSAPVIDLTDDADEGITAVQKQPPSDNRDATQAKQNQVTKTAAPKPQGQPTGTKSTNGTAGAFRIKGVAYKKKIPRNDAQQNASARASPSTKNALSSRAKDVNRETAGERDRTAPKDSTQSKSAARLESMGSSNRGKRDDDSGYTSHESAEKVAIRQSGESANRVSAPSDTAGKNPEQQNPVSKAAARIFDALPSHLRTTSGNARPSTEAQHRVPSDPLSTEDKATKTKTNGRAAPSREHTADGGDFTDDETKEEAKARLQAIHGTVVTEPSVVGADDAVDAQTLDDMVQDQLRQEERKKADEPIKALNESADENTFAIPALPTSKINTPPLFSSLGVQVERVLGKNIEELRADTERFTRTWLLRARQSFDVAEDVPETSKAQQSYSFASYQPIQTTQKSIPGPKEHMTIEMLRGGKGKLTVAVPVTRFMSDDKQPPYSHYVHIQNNYLALNETNLHCQPYFSDDFDDSQAVNITQQYNYDTVERPRKLLQLLQAQSYDDYVTSSLRDLGIAWADVLRFLLDPKPNVGEDLDAIRALQDRDNYCQEDFSGRDTTRSARVLASLPPTSQERLGLAASICEGFLKMANLSMWHVARRHLFDYTESIDENKGVTNEEMTCRVCFRFGCAFHGEIKQVDSDDDEEEKVDDATKRDIIHPLKINYRSRVAFPENAPAAGGEAVARPRGNAHQDKYKWKPDEREPFYPCDHPGTSCEDARCRCYSMNIHCEKSCSCSSGCVRRFTGCKCSHEFSLGKEAPGRKSMCFQDDRCACFGLGRECDPDLCGPCRVCEVLDPVNREDDKILVGRCRNASIQRGVTKHTLLGDSAIHGYGLYAGEDIKAHDFVGEYKGEIITKAEAERRGAVYEHQKLSYLFNLNASQEIDSTYFGNKIRFINHAGNGKNNLYPRIIMVNTVHRIALYGARSVKKGYELFFDYGPLFPENQLGSTDAPKTPQAKGKGKINTPHVRNARAVLDDFHEVGFSEDEDGNARARKVAGTRSRPAKARGNKRPRTKKRLKPAGDFLDTAATSSRAKNLPPNLHGAGSAQEAISTLHVPGRREDDDNSRIDPEDAEERVANYYVRDDMDTEDDNIEEGRAKATVEFESEDDNYLPREADQTDDDDYEDAMEVEESNEEEDDYNQDEEDGPPVKRGRAQKSSNGLGGRFNMMFGKSGNKRRKA